MWKFLPWKRIARRAARAHGMIDPGEFLVRLRRFSRPSEVQEPVELLRAGIVFHARGLVNTKAIQHNMDWVWPFWVERQFKRDDPSFIPRAFSFSHINLTHRNWTAVGLPDLPLYPIVDPRGLVTPLHDGWSLDFWVLSDAGDLLLPSKRGEAEQVLRVDGRHVIETRCAHKGLTLEQVAEVVDTEGEPVLEVRLRALAPDGGWLVAAIRPYNPEGVQFIDTLKCNEERDRWIVNGETEVRFDRPADGLRTSHYEAGDVYRELVGKPDRSEEHCPVGMATGASLYRLEKGRSHDLGVSVSLAGELKRMAGGHPFPSRGWREAESEAASLQIPDGCFRFLYEAAVHTLLQLSADDIFPGVYTYRRFWFRDACLMLNALLALGLVARSRRILGRFPARQTRNGYFSSQEGEWDSNGQVLWIFDRFGRISAEDLPPEWMRAAEKAVDWLEHKRLPANTPHGSPGLLPAGFSAEHLGTNDFYYWDDYWAVAGLRAVADTFERANDSAMAGRARSLAGEYFQSIEQSLAAGVARRGHTGLPAAHGRRMDSGAVGSLVADYPLQLYPPGDPRVTATCEYLIEHSFHHGGFFQEMIHSGINAYLTLDIAQTLLRNGDPRYRNLIRAVAGLASPTGQWPEAIHPNTLGGCMGDGQHGWAAAEWVMALRACFVREEADGLVFCSGLFPEWLASGEELRFGPTATPWGHVTVQVIPRPHCHLVILDAHWHGPPPPARIAVPGRDPVEVVDFSHSFEIPAANEPGIPREKPEPASAP